eukprot:COSAG03_NODE_2373_length_2829_cov_16.656410_2_plen_71_part_00
MIVIDLGVPAEPPYYRLDPARFPDVLSMAKKVKQLTGTRSALSVSSSRHSPVQRIDRETCSGQVVISCRI